MSTVKKNENENENIFNPLDLGQHLCMDFNAVVNSFKEAASERVHGALSGYIYDVPQFADDDVNGGIHYTKYVELPSSIIPQKQPAILKAFTVNIQKFIKPGASFFDIGPGPEWSVRKNTLPSLHTLKPSLYIPVDLEPEFTEEACRVVSQELADIEVDNLAINFQKEALPISNKNTSIIWYPGSTLGNLPSLPKQAFLNNQFVIDHLTLLRKSLDKQQAKTEHTRYLIILMDSKKEDIQSMLDLYKSSDAVGCFKSILFKLKRDLQASDFDPKAFIYKACWNAETSAVEHVFTAIKAQKFKITNCFTSASQVIKVLEGERYALANSLKPSCEDMQEILVRSGWEHLYSETDIDKQFHIHLAKVSSNTSNK